MPKRKLVPAPTPTRERILVISQNPRLRERFYDTLSRREFCVTTAVSCENGLEILRLGEPFGLIFLDSGIARTKRAQFIDRVRYFDEQLPIVALQHPDQDVLDSSTIHRIQGCLSSDSDDHALLAIVSRWLPSRRSVKPIQYPGPILIVDDELELLKSLQEFLQARRCTVVTAASGEEALAQLARHHPTLVLLDIKMPGMDGLVTLKKIKALHPDLPVIMATAVEDEASMDHARVLGAHDYIFKPYNLTVLESLLCAMKERRAKPLAPQAS